ncbi:hypothetical protein R5R35_011056 [Gryllus longicercus]|uniref:Uncharacterized protein n=1 Tax=Gryllus longicercus TaxID=2509291 RepID=A0AAN9V5A0_9ORTH
MILLSVEGGESIYDSDRTTEITPSVLILDEEASISFPLEGEHENEIASAPNEESPPKDTSYVIAEWHNPSQNEMGSKRMSGESSQNEINGEADIQPCLSSQVALQENYDSQSKWKSWNPAYITKKEASVLM